jgi:hypothetical protein
VNGELERILDEADVTEFEDTVLPWHSPGGSEREYTHSEVKVDNRVVEPGNRGNGISSETWLKTVVVLQTWSTKRNWKFKETLRKGCRGRNRR